MNRFHFPLVLGCAVLLGSPVQGAKFGTFDAETVVFLGDSITHAGHYVSFVEARVRELNGNKVPRIINMGLPSETCSGLSEPDHPFPRPTVHERLDRVLAKTKPDLVFACYGMNDGIYYPFSEERFAKYQEGIHKLIRKVKATGAKLVLITPPPFDPLPLKKKGKLLPAGKKKYAWFEIYEGYNGVLDRYAEWLKSQASKVEMVIDVRKPIDAAVANARKKDPEFTLSGDGVHIDKRGHELFARAVMKALGIGVGIGGKMPDAGLFKLVEARHKVAHLAWLTHAGHKRPGPNSKIPFEDAMKQDAAIQRKITAWFTKK